MLKRIAIIENGKITNIVAVDASTDAVSYGGEDLITPAGIHWTKNEDGTFSPPPAQPSVIDTTLLSEIDSILAEYV